MQYIYTSIFYTTSVWMGVYGMMMSARTTKYILK